ncbi:MAG: GGDEF domain-containing protein [Sulfurovum sp.]|uniref:sensor domain-containing diguanylate cyclase n=1 Tax=Sulfurovum sp. TaxID=1969726 RepID=UPI002867B2E8|nr:diguanylate cyclase [Sulfurovum sp.]MCO4845917.1 GGDEF domain-containing protein [Sulfurovum sp.]
MQKTIILLLLFCISLLYGDVHLKAIDLSVPNHAIGQSLLEYEDPTASMILSQVRNLTHDHYKPLNKAVASHPFTKSAFWYQFKVLNKEHTLVSRLMVFEPAWLDSVNITVISSQGQLQTYQGGNIYPYSKREMDHYLINFKHDFEPGISTVYLQVKTRDPFIVSLSILEESAFLGRQVEESVYTGLIYGGIAVMLFYNLFLFFGIKQRYYLYYVLYLSSFFVMNASYNGYTFMYFLSDYPTAQNWLQSTGVYLFMITALLFASSFLNLKKYHQTLYTITAYLIFLIIGIALFSAFIGGYHYHIMLSIILVMSVSIYIFGVALFSWLDGNRSARFFLLGTASGLIGAIITALTVMSFIPFSYMTYKANDFGMLIDAVLLSIALADRVKITLEKQLIAEKEAKTDVITGLFNRRAYYEISEMEYQRLLRHKRILSVIMFDIDHFKNINDNYGHGMGDIVLKHVGNIVKNLIREYDYAFRMGGDEFLVLLPETNEKQASLLAERIRREIQNYKLEENHKLIISASFGIAQYTQKDTSIEKVTRRADEALYQAKKAGRNRVEVIDRFAIV